MVEADLLALIGSSDEQLELQVGRWYVARREMRYVRRNALIALGNVGDGEDPDTVRALSGALRSEDPIVRAHAVWSALRLGRSDLLGEMASETDQRVLDELQRASPLGARAPSPGWKSSGEGLTP